MRGNAEAETSRLSMNGSDFKFCEAKYDKTAEQ